MILIKAIMTCVIMVGLADKTLAADVQDTVVILHGIGHTRWNMYGVEKAMRKEGYATLNITYPSLKRDISGLATFLNTRLTEEKYGIDKAISISLLTRWAGL